MEAKKKFKLKRRYKTFIWVEFSSMLFWVLFFIGLVVVRKNSDGDWSELGIIIPVMLVFISPLMIALACASYAALYRQRLLQYKKAIHSYRARRFLIKTIEYLQMNKIHAAINEYNKSKVREPFIDDIVYGMVISACYSSKESNLIDVGIRNHEKVLNQCREEIKDLN